jgi:outer membrane protein OmpA-like peptidoglycan-associated protein
VIGKADSVGGGAANMHLSQQRAKCGAHRNAADRQGHNQRIETRGTGERQQGGQTTNNGTEAPRP